MQRQRIEVIGASISTWASAGTRVMSAALRTGGRASRGALLVVLGAAAAGTLVPETVAQEHAEERSRARSAADDDALRIVRELLHARIDEADGMAERAAAQLAEAERALAVIEGLRAAGPADEAADDEATEHEATERVPASGGIERRRPGVRARAPGATARDRAPFDHERMVAELRHLAAQREAAEARYQEQHQELLDEHEAALAEIRKATHRVDPSELALWAATVELRRAELACESAGDALRPQHRAELKRAQDEVNTLWQVRAHIDAEVADVNAQRSEAVAAWELAALGVEDGSSSVAVVDAAADVLLDELQAASEQVRTVVLWTEQRLQQGEKWMRKHSRSTLEQRAEQRAEIEASMEQMRRTRQLVEDSMARGEQQLGEHKDVPAHVRAARVQRAQATMAKNRRLIGWLEERWQDLERKLGKAPWAPRPLRRAAADDDV